MINISYLSVPLEYGIDFKIKDNMWITAKNLYKSTEMPFKDLKRIFSSDYKQYSPFCFVDGLKKSENWNNEKQDLLILDVDDGLSIKKAKDIFSKYEYYICTTKSHQQEKKGVKCDRFRILLKAINVPRGDIYFDYMRRLEELFPFIDMQVNTKTGAFLGCSNCEYWYNEGTEFDFNIIKPISKPKVSKSIKPNYNNEDLELNKIKPLLNAEKVRDIISSLGYQVDRNFKFKYRENERTPSASIKNDGYINDFGGDFAGDIFSFVMEVKNIDFVKSVDYVKMYV